MADNAYVDALLENIRSGNFKYGQHSNHSIVMPDLRIWIGTGARYVTIGKKDHDDFEPSLKIRHKIYRAFKKGKRIKRLDDDYKSELKGWEEYIEKRKG